MGTAAQRREWQVLLNTVKADLVEGIEGQRLYDAWGGSGWWTPKVKLTERDAGIVAKYVVDLVAKRESA